MEIMSDCREMWDEEKDDYDSNELLSYVSWLGCWPIAVLQF